MTILVSTLEVFSKGDEGCSTGSLWCEAQEPRNRKVSGEVEVEGLHVLLLWLRLNAANFRRPFFLAHVAAPEGEFEASLLTVCVRGV